MFALRKLSFEYSMFQVETFFFDRWLKINNKLLNISGIEQTRTYCCYAGFNANLQEFCKVI